jgi:hypothetical protein
MTCEKCGSSGLHACPGESVEWTEEKIQEFIEALKKYEFEANAGPSQGDMPLDRYVKSLPLPSYETLNSESVNVPQGLSKEETREFILAVAKKETDKDNCPKCHKPWLDHEFGVPAPFCP